MQSNYLSGVRRHHGANQMFNCLSIPTTRPILKNAMKLNTRFINPISIIALFAALCEASATTVLPHLDEENRQVYIWFLIAFPSTLVILFFLTLNFNSRVLYPPADRSAEQQKPPDKQQDTKDL
ncbi:hypothetical protein [Pseudomonas maioricensis]|nr:hypothetical protein [Pseudomonas sp. S25]